MKSKFLFLLAIVALSFTTTKMESKIDINLNGFEGETLSLKNLKNLNSLQIDFSPSFKENNPVSELWNIDEFGLIIAPKTGSASVYTFKTDSRNIGKNVIEKIIAGGDSTRVIIDRIKASKILYENSIETKETKNLMPRIYKVVE
ncbi:MAG: hypothetical protein H6607_02885 [Flavobacteriales bacterium]|nr:hypothetical protein [Flavobacteriales bacterium]